MGKIGENVGYDPLVAHRAEIEERVLFVIYKLSYRDDQDLQLLYFKTSNFYQTTSELKGRQSLS